MLDADSAKMFVHVFVMFHVDYCNGLLAGSPNYMTDRLQQILNAEAQLALGTCTFDRDLSSLLHNDLHWLDVPELISYKLNVTLNRCLQEKAARYLVDCCTPVSEVVRRRQLCFASRQLLALPCYRLSTFANRAFSVAGPTLWNYLVSII